MSKDIKIKYCDYPKASFLLGAFRREKKQLDWILGSGSARTQKLYNVRHNADLFANRNGGYLVDNKPDYVILYDYHTYDDIKVLECLNIKEMDEQAMATLDYPEPQGSYYVYELGTEFCALKLNLKQLFEQYKQRHPEYKKAEPLIFSGAELQEFSCIQDYTQVNETNRLRPIYRTIDLFAGIGGIRRGFDNAFKKQVETVFVSEWDIPAQQTYRANYPLDKFEIAGDITAIKENEIPPFDICLAGFPCQAFSMAGKHQGFNDDYKGRCRGTLFLDVARICEYHKPKVIFCENVKGLTIHDKGRTFQVIIETFENLGYKVFYRILNSKDFGVPQQRERIYLVCFRNDIAPEEFTFPEGNKKKVCLRDILDEAPVPSKYYLSDTYVDTLRKHRARHEAAGHGFGYVIRPLDGIAGTIVCGGMGRETNLIIDNREHSLVPSTHIKGKINEEGIRKMTPREWARLQGFPDTFILPLSDVHLYKQFGNSVSVPVIEAIAKEIKKVLDKVQRSNS